MNTVTANSPYESAEPAGGNTTSESAAPDGPPHGTANSAFAPVESPVVAVNNPSAGSPGTTAHNASGSANNDSAPPDRTSALVGSPVVAVNIPSDSAGSPATTAHNASGSGNNDSAPVGPPGGTANRASARVESSGTSGNATPAASSASPARRALLDSIRRFFNREPLPASARVETADNASGPPGNTGASTPSPSSSDGIANNVPASAAPQVRRQWLENITRLFSRQPLPSTQTQLDLQMTLNILDIATARDKRLEQAVTEIAGLLGIPATDDVGRSGLRGKVVAIHENRELSLSAVERLRSIISFFKFPQRALPQTPERTPVQTAIVADLKKSLKPDTDILEYLDKLEDNLQEQKRIDQYAADKLQELLATCNSDGCKHVPEAPSDTEHLYKQWFYPLKNVA